MSVHPATRIEIKDEGTIQGRARSLNFVGGLIAAAMSGDVGTITLSLTANDTSTIDLTLSGSTLTADIVSASITNAMINASAAIARSKIASGTATRLVANDGSGNLTDHGALTGDRAILSAAAGGTLTTSATTATEIGYVSGVTSAIQTQINAIAAGLVLLNTYTPSSAASVDITSQITSTYDFYLIPFWFAPATDDVDLWIRTDTSNGASFDASAGNYSTQCSTVGAGGGTGQLVSSSQTRMAIGDSTATHSVGNASGELVQGLVVFFRGSASFPAMFAWFGHYVDSRPTTEAYWGGGQRISNAAIDAVQFLFESGNIASGSAKIYGLK